jgi:hypothetical protein
MNGKKLLGLCIFAFAFGCSEAPSPPQPEAQEEEILARTEFTERIENFFEYSPLRSGQSSQFLIHLTDMTDGAPVERAQVVLTVRVPDSGRAVLQTTAQIGRVTGIYVAEVTIPNSGGYDMEFHIKNSKLDERMLLSGFDVQ